MALATKFYPTVADPIYQPATFRGGWNADPAVTRTLLHYKAGRRNTTTAASETSASNTFKKGLLRLVGDPLAAQTISGTVDVIIGINESAADADFYWALHIYVLAGDTDTVRGTLLNQYAENTTNEFPTSNTGKGLQSAQTLSSVAASEGDRLVIEIGYIARNVLTSSRSATIRYGTTDTSGALLSDLTVGSTSTSTLAGYIQFSSAIEVLTPSPAAGDLLASNDDLFLYDGTTGVLKRRVILPGAFGGTAGPSGSAQDADGNLYLTSEFRTSILVLDTDLLVTSEFTVAPGELPHSAAFDREGNVYIGHTGSSGTSCGDFGGPLVGTATSRRIRKFDPSGTEIGNFAAASDASGTNAIDVDADQTTIFYTSLGRLIKRYDPVGDIQLADFATLPAPTDDEMARGLRVLPDGGVLVADVVDIKRYNRAGELQALTYSIPGQSDWGTVSISPDGQSFWAANTGNAAVDVPMIAKFDLATGDVLLQITDNVPDNGGQLCSGGILCWGGFRAATSEPISFGGVIGPLVWVHVPRRQPDGTIIIDSYSDHDMQDPAGYENGFKEGIVQRFGDGDRALSHPVTGDIRGSTFTILFSDHRRTFRQRLASAIDRYSPLPLTVRMTTRANRAVLGTPYTVFVGPIIDAQPRQPLAWEVTLGDIIYQSILSDQAQQPWRQIRDSGILEVLDPVADGLDLDTPEPIIYGEHLRVPDVDPASPQGFIYQPTFLGIQTVSGNDWYVWLVCGHAVSFILDVYTVDDSDPTVPPLVSSVLADEGTDWLIPHYGGWNAIYLHPYIDYRSPTFGNDRRYTLILGKVGSADPDAIMAGTKKLALAIQGVEPIGDGSGDVITDRLQQYKHFLINYVANFGPASYQAGPWLTNPVWNLFDGPVPIVEEASFDACSAIAAERLPAFGSPASTPGYIGAAIIGAHSGDRSSVRRWIADWNRSCSVRFGTTHLGQLRVCMLHPTAAIKAAAPLYTDAYEILKESFDTAIGWADQANRIPFRTDYEHTSGQWKTPGTADADGSIANYGRAIVGELREYPFAPGITMAYHLARLESLIYQDPPRTITLEATVGPGPNNESLGYLDLGDYIRYRHFASVSDLVGSIRLAQIVRHQVQAGKRRVLVDALDCEDLIGVGGAASYDLPPQEGGEGVTTLPPGGTVPHTDNYTAFDAIPISPFSSAYELSLDTSVNPTDTNMLPGSPGSPLASLAYHAAWWVITPDVNKQMSFSTLGSGYDTQIAVFSGDPGGSPAYGDFVFEGYNDNVPPTTRSVLTLDLIGGTTYYILVAGYGPSDGGALTFSAVAPELADLYVSTSGSDGNTGTIDAPLRTVNEAAARVGSLGVGTVIVRGGRFVEALVNPSLGAADWTNKIRFAAFPGETVWLEGPSGSAYVVEFSGGQSFVEFDGINFDGSHCVNGIIKGESHSGTEAKNIRIKNAALVVSGTHVVSEHWNHISLQADHNSATGGWELLNLRLTGIAYGLDGLPSECFYVGLKDTLIDGCEVADTSANVFQFYNSGGHTVSGCVVRNCRIHDVNHYNPNDGSKRIIVGEVFGANISGVQVYNNEVWNINLTAGATLVVGLSVGSAATTTKVWNNTVYQVIGTGIDIDVSIPSGELKNNIAYLCSTNLTNAGSMTTATNSTSGTNPQFVNPSTGDFRLQAGSPCIDTGTTVGTVTTDIFGVPRPQGAAYDIGAHEFVA